MSGGQARGYSWEQAGPANELARTHGAYVSPLRLSDRAAEIADAIRPHLPVGGAAVETTLGGLCVVLCRIERATAALDDVEQRLEAQGGPPIALYAHKRGDDMMTRLRQDLRSWLNLSLRYADALGLTPSAQARILRDAGIGASAQESIVAALQREARENDREREARSA